MLYVDKSQETPQEVAQAIADAKVKLPRKRDRSGDADGETDYDKACKSEPGLRRLLTRWLVSDQKGLCVYCAGRIRSRDVLPSQLPTSLFDDSADAGDKAHVEHYVPRNPGNWYFAGGGRPSPNDLSLDYKNLFAVCTGSGPTCDTARGNRQLHIDPRNKEDVETVYYEPEAGEEHSSDPAIEADIDTVLNLNHIRLKRRRQHAKDVVYKVFAELTDGDAGALEACNLMLDDLRSASRPPSFAPMMMWILEQKISKMKQTPSDSDSAQ